LLLRLTEGQKEFFVHQANHVVNTVQSLQREHGVAHLLGDKATFFILHGTTTIGFVGDPKLFQEVAEAKPNLVKASVFLSQLSSYPDFKRAPTDRDSVSTLAGETVLLLMSGRNDVFDNDAIGPSSLETDKTVARGASINLLAPEEGRSNFPGNVDLDKHLKDLTEKQKKVFFHQASQVFNTIISLQREHGTDYLMDFWGAFFIPHGTTDIKFLANAEPVLLTAKVGQNPFKASVLTSTIFMSLDWERNPTNTDTVSEVACYVVSALMRGSNEVRRIV